MSQKRNRLLVPSLPVLCATRSRTIDLVEKDRCSGNTTTTTTTPTGLQVITITETEPPTCPSRASHLVTKYANGHRNRTATAFRASPSL
eukprot:9489728-Pyramimonas_sp.AAC.2